VACGGVAVAWLGSIRVARVAKPLSEMVSVVRTVRTDPWRSFRLLGLSRPRRPVPWVWLAGLLLVFSCGNFEGPGVGTRSRRYGLVVGGGGWLLVADGGGRWRLMNKSDSIKTDKT
jgi:hypothetical protein